MFLLWLERSTTRIHETPSASLQRGLGELLLLGYEVVKGLPEETEPALLLGLNPRCLPVEVLVRLVDFLLDLCDGHGRIPASRSLAISRSTQYPT